MSRGMAGGGAGGGDRAPLEAAARRVVAIVDVAIGALISGERVRFLPKDAGECGAPPLSRAMAGGGAAGVDRATLPAAACGVVAIVDVAIGARNSGERVRFVRKGAGECGAPPCRAGWRAEARGGAIG